MRNQPMSYTHLLYHIVFATKDRLPLISSDWENELYGYLGGIVRNHGGEPIEINGMPDHGHLLVRLKQLPSLPDFMRELKASSSKWAKQHNPKFSWQRRYGAFTVSESMAKTVRQYFEIRNRISKTKHPTMNLWNSFDCTTSNTIQNICGIDHACFTRFEFHR
jgi:REP element-mobilizing transposase RayT